MEAEVQQEEDEVCDGNLTIGLMSQFQSGCIMENHFSASCKDLLKGTTNYYNLHMQEEAADVREGFEEIEQRYLLIVPLCAVVM